MSLKQRKYLTKQRFSLTSKYAIPETSANHTFSQDQQITILSKPDDKSICQKYLNIYESINQKQSDKEVENVQTHKPKSKRSIVKTKGMFENPVIQKSYTKLPNSKIHLHNKQNLRNAETEMQSHPSIGWNQRKNPTPSKKNQITLKLINEYKYFSSQKENLPAQQEKMTISGIQILQRQKNSISMKFNSHQNSLLESKVQHDSKECTTRRILKFPFSFWQNNLFVGSNPDKAYTGYYKAKNKTKYDKQREKLERNSTTYIKKVDQSIEVEKYRRMILRPKSSHIKKHNLEREFDVTMIAQHMIQSYEFGREEKMIRTQSEAKLENLHKDTSPVKDTSKEKTNYFGLIRRSLMKNSNEMGFVFNGKFNVQFGRKNSKKYNFNNKTFIPVRNHSSHTMSRTCENTGPILAIRTEQCLNKYSKIVPSTDTESPNIENKHNSKQPKTITPSKEIKSRLSSSKIFHKQGIWSKSPVQKKQWQQKSQAITLNKIQDAIQNDMQLRIQQIYSPLFR